MKVHGFLSVITLLISKSHIERFPADIADWVLHRWPCILGRRLIGSGVVVTHFKNGKTMLIACASILHKWCTQSCARCPADNRPEIERSPEDARPIIIRWSEDYPRHRPIPQLAWRYPQSADRRPMPGWVHDVRAVIARIHVDDSMTGKNGRASEKINLVRRCTDCRLETQMTKNPTDRRRILYVTLV